jgi:hypothetical protein
MTAKGYKKNHYVPQSYLRYWSNDNGKNIFQQNLKNGRPYSTLIQNICNQKNLYDATVVSNPKSLEKDIMPLNEMFIPEFGSYFNSILIDPAKIGRLKIFIIHQSFRTPKFYNENIKQLGLNSTDNLKKGDIYAAFLFSNFSLYIENSVLQIYEINGLGNFITSDNPSSHWIRIERGWKYVNGVIKNESLFNNPNYNIICPISPKHLAILSPNIGIPNTKTNMTTAEIIKVNLSEILKFNEILKYASDKSIFAKSISDFLF